MRIVEKKFKINIFDIVIIVILLALAIFVYKYTHKEVAVETKPIRYTFELTDNQIGFTDLIEVGDEITDNVKNYYMGKVVAVEKVPHKELTENVQTGEIMDAEMPGKETAIVTVEANATESASDFKVNGYFVVKAGIEVAAKGPGYAGRGYILSIER